MSSAMQRDESADLTVPADIEVQGSKHGANEKVVLPPSDNSVVENAAYEVSPGSPATRPDSISVAHGNVMSSPSSMGRRTSLKRSVSNVASLRATFEHAGPSETPSNWFEKAPYRSFSERNSNRSHEQDAEISRLESRLADEVKKRESCQRELETQLKFEAKNRRRLQERCEMLEKKIRDDQTARPHIIQEVPSRTNATHDASNEESGSASMQRQLNELKRSISTATRIGNQVSDATFSQEILKLHHELQNFIVNAFRRTKLVKTPKELCDTLEGVSTAQHFEYLRPLFMALEPSMTLAALQATATCLLMDVFSEPLLFGLPEQQAWHESLRQTVKTLYSIFPPSTFNKWRSLTLEAVRHNCSSEEALHLAAGRVSENICTTLSAITDVQDLNERASSLTSIVLRAVHLSHLFRVQQSQYELTLPVSGTLFRPDLMEDHTLDDETIPEHTIICATFPSVVKYGGEDGENMQRLNVIVKAKVLSRPRAHADSR